jgi:hypothetical protein
MHVLRRKIDEAIGHLEIEDFIEALRDGGWQVADGEGRIMAWRQDVAMLVELDDRPFNSDRIFVKMARNGNVTSHMVESFQEVGELIGREQTVHKAKDNPDLNAVASAVLAETGTQITDWNIRFADTENQFIAYGIGISHEPYEVGMVMIRGTTQGYFRVYCVVNEYLGWTKISVDVSGRRRSTEETTTEDAIAKLKSFLNPLTEPPRLRFESLSRDVEMTSGIRRPLPRRL